MAKDPAFLFYPGDWQGGTSTFNRHMKGCYIDLLIAQFNNGPLSLEEIKVVLALDFELAWPTLQKKFKKNAQNLFFNSRLMEEQEKRAKHSLKQKERITKYWDDKKEVLKNTTEYTGPHSKHNTKPSTKSIPLENGDENENENIIENEVKGVQGEILGLVYPFSSEAFMNKWEQWMNFRQEAKKPYHTFSNVQAALQVLSKVDEQTAIAIIQQSLEKNWINFYELNHNGGKQQDKNGRQASVHALGDAAANRLREITHGNNASSD